MLLLLSFDIKRYFRGRYISEALIVDLYVVSVCACAYKYVRVRLALHMRAVAPISSSSSNSMLYETSPMDFSNNRQTNHGLGEATDVVIGGCSAGGLHVIAHIDAVAALLPPTARVVGYSDSGFPMVCTDPSACMDRDQFLTAESGQNGSHLLNPRCLAAESKPGKCLRADALGKYAETPIFLSQSTYDLANLRDPIVVDPSCEAHPECVNMFGDNMSHVSKPKKKRHFDTE